MGEQFIGNPTCKKCGCTYGIYENHRCGGMDELELYKLAMKMSKANNKKTREYIDQLKAAFAYLEDVESEIQFKETPDVEIGIYDIYDKCDIDLYKDKVREIFAEIEGEYFL